MTIYSMHQLFYILLHITYELYDPWFMLHNLFITYDFIFTTICIVIYIFLELHFPIFFRKYFCLNNYYFYYKTLLKIIY